MSRKTVFTILNVVMGVVITLGGVGLASAVVSKQPLAALLLLFVAAVMPSLIATRVSWASGFAAGRIAQPLATSNPATRSGFDGS